MLRKLIKASLFFSLCISISVSLGQTSSDPATVVADPAISPDFINFGYLQNNTVLPYLQYEALTHIAAPFVNFIGDGTLSNPGTFTGRSSHLQSGGSADRAGTKIILCVRNSNFDEDILDSVMQNAASRTTLVNAVKNLVTADAYCAGVNFDFEFSWGTATRDGITAFIQQMRAALPAGKELSIYTHPTYSATRWNIGALVPHIDYMLYSTYDWGSGSRAHAIADYDNCIQQANNYLIAGLPPEKLVLTWASYGRRWYNQSGYNSLPDNVPSSGTQSQGFYDGLYDTTLRKANGGPFVSNYVTGDEIGFFTYTESGRNYTTVHETPVSLELKIAAALSFPGTGTYAGARLRGVGWWSLMWTADYFGGFQSWDPRTAALVTRPAYYRHIDLLNQEILKVPGQTQHPLVTFESSNDHWRDPNESPDTTAAGTSSFNWVAAPNGAGKPQGTVNAGQLGFVFSTAGQRAFLRHELLNNPTEKTITDTNASLALVSKNTRFSGHYYVPGNYSAWQLRLALVDGSRQVEVSDPITLPSVAGWQTFTWDINDPTQVNAWNTNELTLVDGNGIVNTAGPDARDISFLGFIVEGGPFGLGSVTFDEVTYETHTADNLKYVINEYRYANDASEFVEISGPPGPFPADMQLISYNASSTAGVAAEVTSLAGKSIPASGLYVVGDPGVPNATGTTGFGPLGWGASADDIPNTSPGSLQLYGATSGYVYDSVVYAAYGGLANLARAQTRRVTGEGYPWTGEVSAGLAGSGQPYSSGRMPDSADTNINAKDFSFMPPTPGTPNGASGIAGQIINFSSVPQFAFQTFQSMSLVNPVTQSLPASPGGGNVYRCVDSSGGGVIGVFGDAAMGADTGIDVTGRIFIPAASHPAQAIAVGFCGTQGNTFFSASPQSSGYENGYWLIYENGTNGLADGQPDHPGQFQFLHASNDNMNSEKTTTLGSLKSLAQTQVTAGTWTTFHLRVDPLAAPNSQLVAQINSIDVFRGSVPANGPAKGAFMVGFREATGLPLATTEGTFIDDLLITPANPPSQVTDYNLY